MFVREFMTPHPLTVNEHTRVADARQLLRTHGIRGLPVTRNGDQLIGVVTDRDLRETMTWIPLVAVGLPSDVRKAIEDVEVGVLMDPHPHTIGPDAPLEEAVALMRMHRIGGLPVVEDTDIVGIITETDVLRAFEVALGADTGTERRSVELRDGAPLWQHLKLLSEDGHTLTHVVAYRDRRGGHERALIRTARKPSR